MAAAAAALREHEHVVDGKFIGPGGADDFEGAAVPGDLDDEAEVEERPALGLS
jgi:hypothetical protein